MARAAGRARRRSCALLVAASVVVVPAAAGHQPGMLLRGHGTASVDGVFGSGEWTGAAQVNFLENVPASGGGGTSPAQLYVMNDGANLYVALRHTRTEFLVRMHISFDNDHSGRIDDGEDRLTLQVSPPGWPQPLNYFGDWFVGTSTRGPPADELNGGTIDGMGRMGRDAAGLFAEFSHPLDGADGRDFSLAAGSTVGFAVQTTLEACSGAPGCVGVTDVPAQVPSGGPPGDIAISSGRRGLTIESASITATWRQSVPRATLRVTGRSADPAELSLTADGPGAPVEPSRFGVGAGSFEHAVVLPETALPGRFDVRLEDSSIGMVPPAALAAAELKGPAEGVVRETVFRASRDGPPVTALPAGAREVWVSFRFAARPLRAVCRTQWVVKGVRIVKGKRKVTRKKVRICTSGAVTVVWFPPRGAKPISVAKEDAPVVTSFYRASGGLAPGLLQVQLRVGRRAAATTEIRIG